MEKRKEPPTSDESHFKRLRSQNTLSHHDISRSHSYHSSQFLTPWLPLIARPQDTQRSFVFNTSGTSIGTGTGTGTRTASIEASTRFQGHTAAVHTCSFSPSGRSIASAGADKSIYLWNTNGSGDHYGIIRGRHLGAILDIHWSRAENMLLTACADGTCGAFDAQTGERISTFKGHSGSVTCCSPTRHGPELTASGSIDGSVKVWDYRAPGVAEAFTQHYTVSSVAFSENDDILFTGGTGHKILAWDRRSQRVVYTLSGHTGAITGIRLSPDGTCLLSSSRDNTVRIWNLGPFYDPSSRLQQVLEGAPQGMNEQQSRPAWSNDGLFVGSGAANGSVMIWDTRTGHNMQTLYDHQACVNQVDFHPTGHIVVSSSADKTLALRSLRHL
ncbi:MAG: WD40-repeat-containing domain protein [Linnemannia gamsii]|nr:MAG: WD40-repeat-containing domain protein [Linnemannia gamsii]